MTSVIRTNVSEPSEYVTGTLIRARIQIPFIPFTVKLRFLMYIPHYPLLYSKVFEMCKANVLKCATHTVACATNRWNALKYANPAENAVNIAGRIPTTSLEPRQAKLAKHKLLCQCC